MKYHLEDILYDLLSTCRYKMNGYNTWLKELSYLINF